MPETLTARETAIESLKLWLPEGSRIYVVHRKRTRSGRQIIDCKRIGMWGQTLSIGITVCEALERRYAYGRYGLYGFVVNANELPSLFTNTLSNLLYGHPGGLEVEML